ncbi:hypothetical protein WJX73_009318 [Symbiochloris irregularis]|uniref:Uncharacterized protein n=1 Tax=Symbiochloris irregularis TaxID=706552 RepID=A0AAW1PR80_9CHLO
MASQPKDFSRFDYMRKKPASTPQAQKLLTSLLDLLEDIDSPGVFASGFKDSGTPFLDLRVDRKSVSLPLVSTTDSSVQQLRKAASCVLSNSKTQKSAGWEVVGSKIECLDPEDLKPNTEDGTFAYMAVILPSPCLKGGQLEVSHAGQVQKLGFEASGADACDGFSTYCVAFYAGCTCAMQKSRTDLKRPYINEEEILQGKDFFEEDEWDDEIADEDKPRRAQLTRIWSRTALAAVSGLDRAGRNLSLRQAGIFLCSAFKGRCRSQAN